MTVYLRRWAALGLALLASAIVNGCGERTLDTSSRIAFESSLAAMRSSLDPNEREVFDAAFTEITIGIISGRDLPPSGANAQPADRVRLYEARAREALDGKTAREVIAEAERLRASED